MEAFIILSVGSGFLESKPICCEWPPPREYTVPVLNRYDFGRFKPEVQPDFSKPAVRFMRFVMTENVRCLDGGVWARIYELEGNL